MRELDVATTTTTAAAAATKTTARLCWWPLKVPSTTAANPLRSLEMCDPKPKPVNAESVDEVGWSCPLCGERPSEYKCNDCQQKVCSRCFSHSSQLCLNCWLWGPPSPDDARPFQVNNHGCAGPPTGSSSGPSGGWVGQGVTGSAAGEQKGVGVVGHEPAAGAVIRIQFSDAHAPAIRARWGPLWSVAQEEVHCR